MGTFRVGIKSKLKSELKLELKLSNMYAYGKLISLHSYLPFRTVNRLEDRRQ